jgi:hypothetical protein
MAAEVAIPTAETMSKIKHIQQQFEEGSVILDIWKYQQEQKEYLYITCTNRA